MKIPLSKDSGIFIPIFNERQVSTMPKVKAVMKYYDKQLGLYKEKDEIIEVSEERARQLINSEVAEMVEEPKPKRKTSKKSEK